VNGNQLLEDYLKKHIFGPLGMTSTSFRVNEHPDIKTHLCTMYDRNVDGEKLEARASNVTNGYPLSFDAGGGGLFSKPTDYIKLLTAILKRDPILLKKESYESMFTSQLDDPKHLERHIAKQRPASLGAMTSGGLPPGTKVTWGFGGLLLLEDVPGKRRKGSLSWSGLPNLFWVSLQWTCCEF